MKEEGRGASGGLVPLKLPGHPHACPEKKKRKRVSKGSSQVLHISICGFIMGRREGDRREKRVDGSDRQRDVSLSHLLNHPMQFNSIIFYF